MSIDSEPLPSNSISDCICRSSYSPRLEDEKTVEVLAYLDACNPRKPEQTDIEARAKVVANWSLIVAAILFFIAAIIVFSVQSGDVSEWVRGGVLVIILGSMLSALVSIIIPLVPVIALSFRWRALAFKGMCDDILYERVQEEGLREFSSSACDEAKFWLERRISRISSRSASIFGEKTAALVLLAAGYSFLSGLGGYAWITSTLTAGLSLTNWFDMLLLVVGAAILGMSVGAIFVGRLVARYQYQLSILDLARRSVGKASL